MKDIIKIITALIFILGAYFVGNFTAKERDEKQIEELEILIDNFTKKTIVLKDSINILIKNYDSLYNQIEKPKKMEMDKIIPQNNSRKK